MIFSGAPFRTDGTVPIGAERPTSALPETTISSAVVLPRPAPAPLTRRKERRSKAAGMTEFGMDVLVVVRGRGCCGLDGTEAAFRRRFRAGASRFERITIRERPQADAARRTSSRAAAARR